MSQRNLAWMLVVPGLVLLGAVLSATAPPPEKDYKLVRTVVDVLAEVDKNYVRELSDDEKKKLVEDMIHGGLSRLDPHSTYFNEDDLHQFTTDTEGKFGGIGAYLTLHPQLQILMIESPMVGTPAFEAGLQSGDLIYKIDDKTTENMRVDEARGSIKGPAGTKVVLSILRLGTAKLEEVPLIRAEIKIHAVRGFARDPSDVAKWDFFADKENKIAMIRLTAFNDNTGEEVKAAVQEAERAGAKAMILDMRNNPGGLLSQAIVVSDLFLMSGKIVSTKDRTGTGRKWEAKKDGTLFEPASERPMAVLINSDSASASEIVAAALQDNGRAAIVGERSYGKGSVQKIFELSDRKTAVKLTAEVWLTPTGKNIHRWPTSKESDDWGVRPDAGLDVKLTLEDRRQHILHVNGLDKIKPKGEAPPPAPDAPKIDPNYKDKTLEKALEHLRKKLATGPERKPS